ncbi:MAG: BACON domain-containing protein, partial [Bacteroidales bacterium]
QVTEGITYHWQLCADKGADAPYDSELTLRVASSDLIIDYSDDVCGDDAKISWTADFTGEVKLVITKSSCQTGSEPTTLAYKSGTLEAPYLTLTPNRSLFSTSGTTNFSLGSNTSWNLSEDAPWITWSPSSGNGSASISIIYNANPSSLQREAAITATANAVSDAEVTVKQFPSDPYCNSNLNMGVSLLPTDEWQYNSEMFAGMYAISPVVSGTQYHWSLCSMHGAAVLFDAEQLILRRADNNEFLAYSDGGCGFNDAPVISWTADFNGDVKIVLANSTCEYGDNARLGYKSGELTILAISVSTEMIPLPSFSGTTTFFVYTELPWSIYIPPGKDPSWISVLPQNGVGDTQITVTYAGNQTNIQREGQIVVDAGISTAAVTLVQMPDDGQCNSLIKSGGTLTPDGNWQYYEDILSGEYSVFAIDSGMTYHWSLCPQHGGEAGFDSELTLRRADNNAFITYNNNTCGNNARISLEADYTGLVKLVLSEFPCFSTQLPARIAFKNGLLQNPFPEPGSWPTILTPANKTVSPASGSTTYNIISNTYWELTSDANWANLSQTSGTGNAVITVYYESNTGAERTANISGTVLHVPGTFINNTLTQTDFCSSETYLTTETPIEIWQHIPCIKAGEYAIFPVSAGEKYQWSLNNLHGGNATFNSELTLRKVSDNSFLSHSINFNGVGQDAYLLWNADFTGAVKLILTELNCQATDPTCARLSFKKGNLDLPFLEVSPKIAYADSDSGTLTFDIFSNTFWSLQKNADWISSVTPENGSGNSTLSIDYQENFCLHRIGLIIGSSFGINDVYITIVQDPNLLISPAAYAGHDATILIGQHYPISDATASNSTSVEWSSDGTGYFSDPYIVNPTYFPGSGESGDISLTLSAFGMPGCFLSSTSVLHIDTGMQINLDVKVMLEGSFISDHMTTLLNQNGYLPLVQPYNSFPWNYQGVESVSIVPSLEISDWVLVALRHSNDEPDYIEPDYTVIDRKAGFLMSDGSIKDLDGISYLSMSVADPAKTRVVVWHRNHLSVISSAVIDSVNGNLYSWDFTDGLFKAYNEGQKMVNVGVYGMISGDGDGNGIIEILDNTSIWAPNAGSNGYLRSDYNLNGEVDNKDKNEFWLPNVGSGSKVP